MQLLQIEGNPSLSKDAQTGGVINTDREALMAARRLKDERLAEINKVKNLESKVDELTELVKRLLEEKVND